MQDKEVYLLVTIDTECDKGPGWIIQEPMKFRSVTESVPEVYSPLFNSFDIKPTYLLSPEIIRDEASAATLRSTANCELGTHLHSEFITPQPQWDANRTKSIQMDLAEQVEKEKLTNLTTLFRETFGYAPKSFRAGRFGMTERGLRMLQDLGYTVDSTVSPYKTHYFESGSVRNYWGAPIQPYYPSANDMRKQGDMKILQVPVTIGNPVFEKLPRWLVRSFEDRNKLPKKVLGKLGYKPQIKWLRPHRSTFDEMRDLCRWVIERHNNNDKPVILNMMFHSNEVLINGSPYVKNKKEQEAYLDSLKRLFGFLNETYGCKSMGLSEVKTYW